MIRAARPAAPVAVPLRGRGGSFLERQHLGRAPRARAHAAAAHGLRRGHRRHPARHHQRRGARAPPHAVEPLRLLRSARARTAWSIDDACCSNTGRTPRAWSRASHALDVAPRHGWLPRGPRNRSWHALVEQNRTLLDRVEDAIRTRGPLSSADFAAPPGMKARQLVESQARDPRARLPVDERARRSPLARAAFTSSYDLAERVFTPGRRPASRREEEFRRWHLRRSLHAMGAATDIRPAHVPHVSARAAGRAPSRARRPWWRAGEVVR